MAAAAEPLVLVQRIIDTRYGESERAIADFDALLNSSVQRIHVVEAGDTVQGITSRLFGIGPSATPNEYSKLTRVLQEKNGIGDINSIRAGAKIALPDLPSKQYKVPSQGNPLYGLPRISAGPSLAEVKSGAAFDFERNGSTKLPPITDALRKAAPLVIQWRWLPASVAAAEVKGSGRGVRTIATSGPLEIHFAEGQQTAVASALPADVNYLKALLARRSPDVEPAVYVLDDSWPDKERFEESIRFFRSAVKIVRDKFHLGPAEWDPGLLAKDTQTDFPFYAANRGGHARDIAVALSPLTALTEKVKVVYVPLFLEQKWARQLWREIILVTQTARNKGDTLESASDPVDDALRIARSTTEDLLTQLPSQVQGGLTQTDQIAVSALLKFAQLYALATGTPYFLNMSWTVVRNSVDLVLDSDSLGLPVAAIGNDLNIDIIEKKTQFAYRAKAVPGDVLAVMNSNSDGSLSCSSLWNVPNGEQFYGLAYEGVLPSGTCGTSLAAPRVAWLLALREAYKGRVQQSAVSNWFGNYRAFLLNLQSNQRAGYLRYWLAPQQLFNGL